MFTRITLGSDGAMANADHLLGSLALTIISLAAAEVTRAMRFLLVPVGIALLATPFLYGANGIALVASIICGIALIGLSFRRGPIRQRYGSWDAWIR